MADNYNDGELCQSAAGRAIEAGEKEQGDAYLDKIYMAYWDGTNHFPGKLPCPITDRVVTKNDFTSVVTSHTMRLSERHTAGSSALSEALRNIDGKKKYNFSFLSKTIPNPRALFYIRGAKYICEKITATFKEGGRSLLLKGVFYRVLD